MQRIYVTLLVLNCLFAGVALSKPSLFNKRKAPSEVPAVSVQSQVAQDTKKPSLLNKLKNKQQELPLEAGEVAPTIFERLKASRPAIMVASAYDQLRHTRPYAGLMLASSGAVTAGLGFFWAVSGYFAAEAWRSRSKVDAGDIVGLEEFAAVVSIGFLYACCTLGVPLVRQHWNHWKKVRVMIHDNKQHADQDAGDN